MAVSVLFNGVQKALCQLPFGPVRVGPAERSHMLLQVCLHSQQQRQFLVIQPLPVYPQGDAVSHALYVSIMMAS